VPTLKSLKVLRQTTERRLMMERKGKVLVLVDVQPGERPGKTIVELLKKQGVPIGKNVKK